MVGSRMDVFNLEVRLAVCRSGNLAQQLYPTVALLQTRLPKPCFVVRGQNLPLLKYSESG
eukprot:9472181-Pyramimonas_sp.AAC.2